jgi:ribosomal protein S18 acetylase RimI-like enzyme
LEGLLPGGSGLPAGLAPVAFDRIDWPRAAALSADCFRDVPNSPAVSAEMLAADWAEADWSASRLLQDASGAYQAYLIVTPDAAVDAVGLAPGWRGQGLADALYAEAAAALHRRGVSRMHALVASSNRASMRLHQRLGFTEPQPRGAVWELALAGAPPCSP